MYDFSEDFHHGEVSDSHTWIKDFLSRVSWRKARYRKLSPRIRNLLDIKEVRVGHSKLLLYRPFTLIISEPKLMYQLDGSEADGICLPNKHIHEMSNDLKWTGLANTANRTIDWELIIDEINKAVLTVLDPPRLSSTDLLIRVLLFFALGILDVIIAMIRWCFGPVFYVLLHALVILWMHCVHFVLFDEPL